MCPLNDVSLNDVSLNDVSLNDVSLNDVSLNDVSLNDVFLRDNPDPYDIPQNNSSAAFGSWLHSDALL
jgi:hypothetical protein